MKKLSAIAVSAAISAIPATALHAAEISFGGAVEVEAVFGETVTEINNQAAVVDQSDIAVATVELGLDATINDKTSATVTLLYEEDDTDLEVDVATITRQLGNGFYLTAGQTYVPFGAYETNLVSDPLTLEIGETRETVAQIGFEADNGFSGSVYIFNGDTIETSTDAKGDDTIENAGLNLGYATSMGNHELSFGLGYINNIADSDAITGYLDNNTVIDSYVSGTVIHASYVNGPFNAIVEFLNSDQFKAAEMSFKGQGAEPSAFNIEVGYGFDLGGKAAVVALAFQGTDEAIDLELPEQRILLGLSMDIDENNSVGFEYSSDEDYATTDGGTGLDISNLTVQWAVSF